MKIGAALAADLGILTAALDEPGADMRAQCAPTPRRRGRGTDLPRFRASSFPAAIPPSPFSSLWPRGHVAGDVRTSLHVLLPGIGDGQDPAAVALVLYAGRQEPSSTSLRIWPGSRGDHSTDVTLEKHLTVAARPEPPLNYRRHQISTRPSASSSDAVIPPTRPLAT